MSHIDDGKLNALLDGELDAAEAEGVRAHIAACAECARRLEEAKQFLAGAADLLGALDLPPSATVPAAAPSAPPAGPPARRVSKTAKEVAIDIDGATHKSPAIRPNLPEPTPPAWRQHFDVTNLAWAAMIVLAIGVGFLANEVRHSRRAVTDEARLGAASPTAPAAAPGPAAVPAAARAVRADRASQSAAKARPRPRAAAPATTLAAKSIAPATGKHLAAPAAPAARRQTARGAVSTELAAAREAGAGAPAARAPAPAAAESVANRPAALNAAAPGVAGIAAARDELTGFRRVTLEEAVARLNGAIRLIDGMRVEQVEVGPARLAPGADRGREVVRLVYFDAAGRRLELDEQRVTVPPDGGIVSPDIGMRPGDTLTSTTAAGPVRVRWIDRTFWLSLSGALPPDELRRLVERVR